MTDTERLDLLERYLSDPAKNMSQPWPTYRDHTWEFGYNAGPAYCIEGAGDTLRGAIDNLAEGMAGEHTISLK